MIALLLVAQANDETQSMINQLVVLMLIPTLLAFVFFVFIFYRQRREIEVRKKELELTQQLSEVEMKTLRAQMNPHFIFNALNSIYHFIKNKNEEDATGYLLRFSKLMRLVLEHSMKSEVLLSEELESLELYMQIEMLRVRHGFTYKIEIEDGLMADEICFPPLLLQPFVENSIWHGFGAKDSEGFIHIRIAEEGDMLHVTITDNGESKPTVALHPAIAKKTSLGTEIIRERLAIINDRTGKESGFTRKKVMNPDGTSAGTEINLLLPLVKEDSSILFTNESGNI